MLDRGADPSVPLPGTVHSVLFEVFASLPQVCPPSAYFEAIIGPGDYREEYKVECATQDSQIIADSAHVADTDLNMAALVRDLLPSGKEEHLAIVNEADADGHTALHWAAA